MDYQSLLRETELAAASAPEAASTDEAAALERFKDFFSNMTPERVKSQVESIYDSEAILYDTIALHRGIEEIKPYFIRTAERAAGVRVEIIDTLRKENDFYVKWLMEIDWSAFKKGKTTISPGMSHIRFNGDGKVILHFDFWDSATGFYEHIPVVGMLIRWIKRKAS